MIITGPSPNNHKDTLRHKYKFKKPIFSGQVKPTEETDWLKEKPILAYAGIAQPEKLFHSLERAGGKVIRRLPFPDHHEFKPKDAAELTKLAIKDDLQLVTTTKDLVRLHAQCKQTFPAYGPWGPARNI